MRPSLLLFFVTILQFITIYADVTITIDTIGIRPISPYIYGRNNSFNDDPEKSTSDSAVQLYKEAGIKIFRENGGNNCTKYNWHKKLSSHPDWYNNVYKHDWSLSASDIQKKIPGAQGLFALQLLGWAGKTESYNFDCWNFDECKGSNAAKNYAGGVTISQLAADSTGHGDPLSYLESWPADSTVGILSNWFSAAPDGAGLDSTRFRYWNMDNEPEVWRSTHDDIADTNLTAEGYMQLYFKVAKKARSIFQGIKLVGPVFTNEWQWWTWNNKLITTSINGKDTSICWFEYFIKRIGEEQKATGIRLLDVIDFHFYPSYNTSTSVNDLLQVHRIFYDTTYLWSGSNGVHMLDGQWNKNVANYIFLRANRWLDHYLGKQHGVNAGISEYGSVSGGGNASVTAVNYASMLGTFGREGVELFTPWDWYNSWWEVIHLFSRYGQPFSLKALSSVDSLVSAYPMIGKDTLTIILVNRAAEEQSVNVKIGPTFGLPSETHSFQISGLPQDKTFISHENNALKKSSVPISDNSIQIKLPAYSVTAAVTRITNGVSIHHKRSQRLVKPQIFNNGSVLKLTGEKSFMLIDITGKVLRRTQKGSIDIRSLSNGMYLIRSESGYFYSKKLLLNR